jgi:hypothetical protein
MMGLFIATHLTMTHALFPIGVLPDVWVGFRRVVVPVDRVAVLPAGIADRRAPRIAFAGVVASGRLPGGSASAVVARQVAKGVGAYLAVLFAAFARGGAALHNARCGQRRMKVQYSGERPSRRALAS